ncbi:hypothetical protein ACFQT0_09920 [Hymenobacter humi]|uniref:Uncharacterized protein n=1 Tax=Hymenobacter humi TaxID=1411620 RepID=A0ABW2U5R0_9BACT
MDTFLALNRCPHIVAGFTGFFVAPAVRKGGAAHQRWGWPTVLGVPLTRYWYQRGRAQRVSPAPGSGLFGSRAPALRR